MRELREGCNTSGPIVETIDAGENNFHAALGEGFCHFTFAAKNDFPPNALGSLSCDQVLAIPALPLVSPSTLLVSMVLLSPKRQYTRAEECATRVLERSPFTFAGSKRVVLPVPEYPSTREALFASASSLFLIEYGQFFPR